MRCRAKGLSRGYVLVECVVAMAVLSITMMGIQQSLRQAIIATAMAQDYTTCRRLMENLMAEIEMEPWVYERQEQGTFAAPNSRFTYKWEITKVEVPRPPLPEDIPKPQRDQLAQGFQGYMPKVRVEIEWVRAGLARTRVGETLLDPSRLWFPPRAPGT